MKKQIVLLSMLASALVFAQEETPKSAEEKNIEEVIIRKTKKPIEQKADRTIFDFSEQPNLNSGTALEGIKKLPGLMSSDLTGMAYQGKPLAVYMDGRPLNITSTELNAFLEGLPASTIEKIEVITNPGAEFPATGGGAILNIITSRSAKSYLTATYSGNYSFSNYDKYRSKTNHSVLLNSKNKWFGWQLNVGGNYREATSNFAIDNLSNTTNDEVNRGYFARTALNFDLGQDRLILNYNLNHGNNDDTPLSFGTMAGINYNRQDATENKRWRHEAVATYQKRFDDAGKRLNFKLSYTQIKRDFLQDNLYHFLNLTPMNVGAYSTASDARIAEFRIDYSQDIPLLDGGKINIGGLYEKLNYDTEANRITNLDYQRQTISTFAELQATKGKWNFVAGVRGEDYDISGLSYNEQTQNYDNLTAFKKYKFFPNASVQYNFSPMINLALNYNKKISLPSISRLNPNSDFTNGVFYNTGNANLQPTIYDNLGMKLSAFNYLFLSYSLDFTKNEIIEVMNKQGNVVNMTTINIASARLHNFSAGFPMPLDIFRKSLKEIMMSNPDKMNFLYFVGVYGLQDIPSVENKGFWYFNVNGQIILPKDIKLSFDYSVIPAGTGYYYYGLNKPVDNALNLTLSKKFLKDQLSVSVFAQDIFNSSKMDGYSRYQQPYIKMTAKSDSRVFGVSVNYKIPTKNKLAKENPNFLLENKQEEKGGLIK